MSEPAPRVDALTSRDSWEGVRAVVVGFDAAGASAVDNLLHLGADVHAVSEDVDPGMLERVELFEVLGARVDVHAGATAALPREAAPDLLVVTPDIASDCPALREAERLGVPVWGEVELAWRLRTPDSPPPWLAVTGADLEDVALTTSILGSILTAAGLQVAVAGEGGAPLVETVMDPEARDVLAVGLSARQLERAGAMAAESAAVLSLAAPDAAAGADEAVRRAVGRIYHLVAQACVYPFADERVEDLVRDAEVTEGARAIALTLGTPAVSMLGVVENILVDRAFIEERATSAAELGTFDDLAEATPRYVQAALAASALARAHGVGQVAVRDGLRAHRP
ncbi:hypothetical protein [Nocardioides sp.]|uniref:hypothetical protein n=1 Tax=Nocardioides sp. TaxID=35761 RepID=UPI00351300DD